MPLRFIPAGAGNTPAAPHEPLRNSVYPRWRGEHRRRMHRQSAGAGLSPLARGTQCPRRWQIPILRFIPAGAGNTTGRRHRFLLRPVYPRWRGEHFSPLDAIFAPVGLSPLARGTHVELKKGLFRPRFIPAGAGNTFRRTLSELKNAVYPRWRGEHYISRIR